MIALSFVIFAVLNVVVLARPSSVVEMSDDKAPKVLNAAALSALSRNFKCKPQPRAFLAKNYLPKPLAASEMLKTNNIILHICDAQSGCCLNNNKVCGPKSAEPITFQLEAEDTFTKAKRIIEITEYNHTKCECAGDSQPKRKNINDGRVELLTSAGVTNNPTESKLLCVAYLLYFIYHFSYVCNLL